MGTEIPKGNIADFSKKTIITSKKPLTKEQIDSQCRFGALAGGTNAASLTSGVYLGAYQKDSIFSALLGKKPETIHYYGCKKETIDY